MVGINTIEISRRKRPEPASPPEVNIVLLGKTGAGKSASGNTILGEKKFKSACSAKSMTRECQEATALVAGRRVTVLDTPGLYDTKHGMEKFEEELQKVEEFSRRSQCIFLLVIELGRFTEEVKKCIEKIEELFPEQLTKFMVLFTNGDRLDGTIEEFLEEADDDLEELMNSFGMRYHVFNNKSNPEDRVQVVQLMEKIDDMLMRNKKFSEGKIGQRQEEIERIWQEMEILSK